MEFILNYEMRELQDDNFFWKPILVYNTERDYSNGTGL